MLIDVVRACVKKRILHFIGTIIACLPSLFAQSQWGQVAPRDPQLGRTKRCIGFSLSGGSGFSVHPDLHQLSLRLRVLHSPEPVMESQFFSTGRAAGTVQDGSWTASGVHCLFPGLDHLSLNHLLRYIVVMETSLWHGMAWRGVAVLGAWLWRLCNG
jgi:hypothetical protein